VVLSLAGCFTPPSPFPYEYDVELVRVSADSADTAISVSLEGTYVEAYADTGFTILVRRSVVNVAGERYAVVDSFWLPEGTYYIRAWKDVDGDSMLSPGDIYGALCAEDTVCLQAKPFYADPWDNIRILVSIYGGR